MNINCITNETCHTAHGLVVVIDVLRAFSTAAYTFHAGAKEIILVSGVDEALALRARIAGALAIGEVNGEQPAGFDFNNSPTEIRQQNLSGKSVIQRTSAGTQGVVHSINASVIFAASFVVAEATVRAIRALAPKAVTFVVTGGNSAGEDQACADYLEARLRGQTPDPAPYLRRVRDASKAAFTPAERYPYLRSDLELCTALDAFPFAMPVVRDQGRYVLHAVIPNP